IEPYISDFSAILSFALNCIATPDHDLTSRLKSNQRGLSIPVPPNKIVSRFFESEIILKPNEESYLVVFIDHLIGLKREHYLGVMRAIRTYVTGMHRVADDLELAYTLIVASIESLAQDFDGHDSSWDDLDQRKRKLLDEALKEAETSTASKVREAILEIEHTSLSKRFRTFATQNVSESFFREEAEGINNPIARSDLSQGLKQAYIARSKYIHNLKELPKLLTLGDLSSETVRIDNQTWFSLQGLCRLARHAITEFVFKQPTVESEVYDYRLERSGIVMAPMAPQYWVGNADNINRDSGAKRLEGFLQQLSLHLLSPKGSTITDLQPVLCKVESLLQQMKKCERLPFVTLYFLFNGLLSEEKRMKAVGDIEKKFIGELKNPSPESLVYHLLFNQVPDWELQVHRESIMTYFKTRDNRGKIRIPRVFEAGILLSLAERYRLEGNYENAKEQVSFALENYPENMALRKFEEKYIIDNTIKIIWGEILLSSDNVDEQSEEDA
ncbi:hypothetical protein, partial [Shewanella colwelliana]|uniref:hypothetical protein n=1 Tax=Shewanella colwelliana TaxID=23 RepID=UPI001C7CFBAF